MEFQALQYETIFRNYLYQLREKYHEAFMKNFLLQNKQNFHILKQ